MSLSVISIGSIHLIMAKIRKKSEEKFFDGNNLTWLPSCIYCDMPKFLDIMSVVINDIGPKISRFKETENN